MIKINLFWAFLIMAVILDARQGQSRQTQFLKVNFKYQNGMFYGKTLQKD